MRKILIALDYSPTAQTVAETGYELAKAMIQRLRFCCVKSPCFYEF